MTERQRDRRYDQLREAVDDSRRWDSGLTDDDIDTLLKLIDKAQAAGVEIE